MKNTVSEKVREKKEVGNKRRSLHGVGNMLLSFTAKILDGYSELMSDELESRTVSRIGRIKMLVSSVLITLLSVILCRTEMGESCYPIAVALVCAAGTRKRSDVFSPRLSLALSIGSAAASTLFMGTSGMLYFSVLVTVFVIRGVVTHTAFNERTCARALTSFFTSLLIGMMNSLISDFSLLSLVCLATLVTVTPIFTYLIIPLFDMIGRKKVDSRFSLRFGIGVLTVLFMSVYALGEVKLIGLSLSLIIAFCITVAVSKAYGCISGGVSGVILGLGCSSPVASAVLGCVGVMSGLLFPVDIYALLSTVPITVAVSVFLGGSRGFLSTVPEVMTGFLIMWPTLLKIPNHSPKITEHRSVPTIIGDIGIGERLERLSGVFSSLSEVFYAESVSSSKPDEAKIRELVTESCNGVCATCSASSMCWGKKWRDTRGVVDTLAQAVVNKGKLTYGDIPEYFRERCAKSREICDKVNERAKEYAGENLDTANRTVGEYKTVSRLLKSTAELFATYPERCDETAKKISTLLDKLGIKYTFVEAWGGRNTVVDAVGVRPECVPMSAVELVSIFETVCNIKFEEPEFIISDAVPVMRFKRRRALRLECAKSTCSKKGESVSGDTVSFFENDNGAFYSLICDGMGSGNEAAMTSRLASVFLEKLLRCVQDMGITVELVNKMLLERDGECFTTLDLLEIDLYEKNASFIKAGAAPSFVLRDGKLYRVNSKTVPAGIIHDLVAEETTVHLRGGDTVVLLSDGILDSDEEIEIPSDLSASEISDSILKASLLRFSARDDMSVAVIKVFED